MQRERTDGVAALRVRVLREAAVVPALTGRRVGPAETILTGVEELERRLASAPMRGP